MFQIFEIRGKRFEYSNNIRAKKFSNPNPNIRDSRKKIRIRIESEYIRSSLLLSQHKMITSSVAEADWKLQDFYKFPTEEKYILLFPMEKSFALNLTILHKMFKSCL